MPISDTRSIWLFCLFCIAHAGHRPCLALSPRRRRSSTQKSFVPSQLQKRSPHAPLGPARAIVLGCLLPPCSRARGVLLCVVIEQSRREFAWTAGAPWFDWRASTRSGEGPTASGSKTRDRRSAYYTFMFPRGSIHLPGVCFSTFTTEDMSNLGPRVYLRNLGSGMKGTGLMG